MIHVLGCNQLLAHRNLLWTGEAPGHLPGYATQWVHHQAMCLHWDLFPVREHGSRSWAIMRGVWGRCGAVASSHSLRLWSDWSLSPQVTPQALGYRVGGGFSLSCLPLMWISKCIFPAKGKEDEEYVYANISFVLGYLFFALRNTIIWVRCHAWCHKPNPFHFC